ncbi:hypothetical protein EV127DRAFT_189882 [Xylaria flabelliformis]|nr:hypothetical protein EV127DRAFT_189882 [Xylaria flabelliformis]
MAHGFEKLERLFTGSRRKGRGGQNTTTRQQKTSIITERRPSSPLFPPPSYLRPTSTHMTPRDAQIGSPEWEKDRCQSVPTLQEALHKRSSAASSITIVNRPRRSDASVPSSRHRSRDSQITSRPFRFRFPEDSLFKNNRPIRTSEDSGKAGLSPEQSPRSCTTESQGLLDWSPKHISLLFNPLDFKAPSSDGPWVPGSDSTKSSLLPSPDFVPLAQRPANHELVDKPGQPTLLHTSLSPRSSVRELTLNQRELSPSSYRKPLLDSPAPNNNEDKRRPTIHRSVSLSTMAPSSLNTAHMAPIAISAMKDNKNFGGRRNVRETWGNRLEDPRVFGDSPSSDSEGVSNPKIRKSASTSTLSILTSKISKDRVLEEPTFDDFYALSDDDIAEDRPCTPVPLTPTPDIHNSHRRSRPPQANTSQHITPSPRREEITPSRTPTDRQLLALSCSPAHLRDTFGALWAAVLARKYDFAVLYVLSLWPVGGDHCLDVSVTGPTSKPQPAKTTATKRLASTRGPKISGRLLAAYGLNEVPSPFEIATDTHLAALNCDRWNEYRNVDARPNDISRGWIRPFYSDYTSVSMSTKSTGSLSNDHPRDRGIVFAAYSKQTLHPLIPMTACPEQDLILQQLYTDAKALVGALVK